MCRDFDKQTWADRHLRKHKPENEDKLELVVERNPTSPAHRNQHKSPACTRIMPPSMVTNCGAQDAAYTASCISLHKQTMPPPATQGARHDGCRACHISTRILAPLATCQACAQHAVSSSTRSKAMCALFDACASKGSSEQAAGEERTMSTTSTTMLHLSLCTCNSKQMPVLQVWTELTTRTCRHVYIYSSGCCFCNIHR
jgi:hypothetical protein